MRFLRPALRSKQFPQNESELDLVHHATAMHPPKLADEEDDVQARLSSINRTDNIGLEMFVCYETESLPFTHEKHAATREFRAPPPWRVSQNFRGTICGLVPSVSFCLPFYF